MDPPSEGVDGGSDPPSAHGLRAQQAVDPAEETRLHCRQSREALNLTMTCWCLSGRFRNNRACGSGAARHDKHDYGLLLNIFVEQHKTPRDDTHYKIPKKNVRGRSGGRCDCASCGLLPAPNSRSESARENCARVPHVTLLRTGSGSCACGESGEYAACGARRCPAWGPHRPRWL